MLIHGRLCFDTYPSSSPTCEHKSGPKSKYSLEQRLEFKIGKTFLRAYSANMFRVAVYSDNSMIIIDPVTQDTLADFEPQWR